MGSVLQSIIAEPDHAFQPILILCTTVVFSVVIGRILLRSYASSRKSSWEGPVLFVTAHPDDESMFFAPSIIHCLSVVGLENVYLLCLTTGNYYGLGNVREKEIFMAGDALGLKTSNIFVLNHAAFQDGNFDWDLLKVFNEIEKKVEEFKVKTIVTFDAYGISGHADHIDVYKAILTSKNRKCLHTKSIKLYTLESVNILRKYLSVVDLAYSIIDGYFCKKFYSVDKSLILLGWSNIWKPQQAMAKHKSQHVWFRNLYVVFSRYMLMNSLKLEGSLEF